MIFAKAFNKTLFNLAGTLESLIISKLQESIDGEYQTYLMGESSNKMAEIADIQWVKHEQFSRK